MEKSLAAMHQARLRHPVTLIYGSTDEQVGLFVRCHAADRDAVLQPILANYQHATVTLREDERRTGECTLPKAAVWHSDVQLVPELFPILRHAQFKDALNHNFADPVSGLFRAILPEPQLSCRIEICIRPATRRRCHEARLRSDLLYERNARLLAGSFSRERFEQFMNRYLGNDTSPDLVEKREQLLREMIMDSLGTTPAPKFASMTDLAAFFAARRHEISALPHADDVKDAYIVQLNKQEDEALRRFLKP